MKECGKMHGIDCYKILSTHPELCFGGARMMMIMVVVVVVMMMMTMMMTMMMMEKAISLWCGKKRVLWSK